LQNLQCVSLHKLSAILARFFPAIVLPMFSDVSDLRYLRQLGVQVECGCYDCDVTSTQISDDSERDLLLDPSLAGGAACVSVLLACFCLSVCSFGYGGNKISRIV